ncbi:MAG: hypothetical protein QOI92_642 [Chloroflexota bacterium]|nr:hypothetical protein [Chloroflexota bacterium]
MTVLAGVAPRIAAIVAQHGASIAAGALSGALLGGAGVATGVVPTGGAANGAPSRALTACPGSGAEVGRISSGTPLLVTARSADGAWLQVYIGGPGIDSGWASADALKLRDAASSLPVADCGVQPSGAPTPGPVASPPPPSQIALPTATAGPSPSPTPRPTASAKATAKPTRTPKPTPVPTSYKDPNPPIITGMSVQQHCEESSFGVSPMLEIYITDADDADSALVVRLFVDPPGPLPEYEYTGPYAPFVSLPGNWEAQWQQSSQWPSGVVKWRITVTDPSGNAASRSSSSNSSDPTWIWNESTGSCPTPLPT